MTHAPITRPVSVTSPRAALLSALAALGGLLLLAALFGRIMDFGLRRDEMLFVAPAVLLDTGRLYHDFFYNHVPYSAWLFRASYLVFGDLGLLFSARLVIFAGWLLLIGASVWSVTRLSGSALLGGLAAVALVSNDTLLGQAGMAASNNLLPLAFSILALGLFLVEIQYARPRFIPLFVMGLSLSIAIGLKVSAGAILPPLLIAAFLVPRHLRLAERLRHVVLPAVIGGLLGAVPLFVLLIQDPQTFLAHVVGFHTGPHVAYWAAHQSSEPGLAMGLRGKMMLADTVWLSGSALLIAMLSLGAGWAVLSRGVAVQWASILVALAVLGASMAMSFLPTPGFPQYYAAPVVVLPLLTALLVQPLAGDRLFVPVMAAAIPLMLVMALPRLVPGLVSLASPDRLKVMEMAQGGRAIASTLTTDGPVATFLPLYPLEEGVPVYPELATGQFAYRIADLTPPDLAEAYVMAGTDAMIARFETTPPAAFLLGYEPALEAPFKAWATQNGYAPLEKDVLSNRYGDGVLLVRPKGRGTP